MLRPRRLIATAILVILTAISFALRDGVEYVGIVFLIWVVMVPINLYRVLAKTVATQKELTDPRTVDFSSSRIAASGPVESPLKRIAPTRQNEHNGADVRKATHHDG